MTRVSRTHPLYLTVAFGHPVVWWMPPPVISSGTCLNALPPDAATPCRSLSAQPLAVVGGVFALWLAGYTLNIYSMIGMVLLVGLVSKNSILLVDLINRCREQGMDTATAILTACPRRMRPVLMTSFTIILAMLPAALGVGVGAGQYGPLAVAVIGGVVSSTLLTLVVIPVAYSLLAPWLRIGAR